MTFEPEVAEARSIARHGIAHGWPPEDIEAEIVERLRFRPSDACDIVLQALRERQEDQIQQAHDQIAYDAIWQTE